MKTTFLFLPLALAASLAFLPVASPQPAVANANASHVSSDLLNAASVVGDVAEVRGLLARGSDVNAKDELGMTALHRASLNGHVAVVETLFAEGADVHAEDNEGETPLHAASLQGHLAVVELLLAVGADVNAKDNLGWTALHEASMKGHVSVVGLLLAEGADTTAKDDWGSTSLHYASSWGYPAVVEILDRPPEMLLATLVQRRDKTIAGIQAKLADAKKQAENKNTIEALIKRREFVSQKINVSLSEHIVE